MRSDGGTLLSISSPQKRAELSPPPPVRDEQHEARTVRAIRQALATVPFYAKLGLAAPAPGEDATLAEVLPKLPLLTPAKIRATLPKAWLPEGRDVRAEMAEGKISVVETGSGDARTRILWDGAWWRRQEDRALRVNPRMLSAMAGEMGAYRDSVLWVPERGTGSCGAGDPSYEDRLEGARLHLNSRQDPAFWTESVMTRMLDELALHGTVGLLADPFYLDVLARHAISLGRKLDVKGFVALTRALTTSAHREAIGKVHDHVVDVFGAREAGILFVEAEDKKLHHAPSTTHVELLPAKVETPGAENVALVVVTTLDRDVQPLVRYVLGDLVEVAEGAPRYTTVSPIARVSGKLDDAVVRPDGAILTPAAMDRALAPLSLRAYQVTQREPNAVEIEVVGGSADAARDALATLATGMTVTARSATAIAAEPNGKYHTSRRHIPLALSSSFDGAAS
ncbi:hypothetical protein AKJ09_02939 [Labilithrix luteola]|uniref:Uncharacterized protein n=1 Tax=Labilithrix luteola TaxID=1391654 RepID=A0A0K1PRW2_9BACT|nr:hypothetical protein [Labilithrix luteola]AKU96275.1 hypothetical protein AKJ09_02939 [Labilithrix luteola]